MVLVVIQSVSPNKSFAAFRPLYITVERISTVESPFFVDYDLGEFYLVVVAVYIHLEPPGTEIYAKHGALIPE